MTGAPDPNGPTVELRGAGIDSSVIGSKAASIDLLLGLGTSVPRSGVVTTLAYRELAGQPELRALIDELRVTPIPERSDLESVRQRVDGAFLSAPLCPEVAAAIVDLASTVGAGGPIAVRSSATAEDLGSASFAGQYRTLLAVEPKDVIEAVRLCWASLWHPEPMMYRRFRGIDDADLAMAVLIMPMLDPSHAGVLFTENPGQPRALRIEMVEGLGESLVSGARTPSIVAVDRAEIERFDAEPEALRHLAEISLDLESEFGFPLDLEWAIDGGEVLILQARPITTTSLEDIGDDGFDVGDPDSRLTTAGIAEMMPGVLPPRIWDTNSWLIEESFRGLFADLGAAHDDLDQPHALIGRVKGRAVLDLDRMEHVVESIPGGSAAELEHQYFGDILDPIEAPRTSPADGSKLVQAIRTLRARSRAFQGSEVVIQAIGHVLEAEPELSALDDGRLLGLRGRVVHLLCHTMEAEVSVAATASASYRGLEMFLREHLDDMEAKEALQGLLVSDRAGHRGRRALDLDDLAAQLAEQPALSSARALESWPEALLELRRTPVGQGFVASLMSELRRAGSTSIVGGPTWESVPELVWPMLRQGPQEPTGNHRKRRAEVVADLGRRVTADPRWRHTRAITGQFVDVRRRFLRREASDAVAFLERREHTKASLLMLGGVLWRIDREIGHRLEQSGRLETIDDVDLLTGDEITQLIDGQHLPFELIARRRRRVAAARLEPPLPNVFVGRPSRTATAPVAGDVVQGWAGSPGRYEGRARIVDSPSSSSLRRGEVLVAHTTDSSWLPLFHIAGAIVVEEGGPLSHATILARELGMPAVVNIPGIVDKVRSRSRTQLTVDGSTGTVVVHGPEKDGTTVDPSDGIVPPREVPATPNADRLGVFVTGLIGVGAFMSVAIGLTQAIGSVGTQQRIAKQARPRADALAAGVIKGFDGRPVGPAGLRPRGYYLWLATLAFVGSILVLWTGDDYLEGAATPAALWWFALCLVGSFTMVVFATQAMMAVARWPDVSAAARRFSLPRIHERVTPAQIVGRVHESVIAAGVLAVLVLAWLAAEAEGALLVVDEWIFGLADAGPTAGAWHPSFFDDVLRKEVMIPLALVLTIAVRRCRPLMLTFPLVITGGGLIHLTLQHFLARARPESGPKPGFVDSFPGGHANELTIMIGLLPVAVFVLTRRIWLRRTIDIACGLLLLVMLVDTVRAGDHWPTDNLAGFIIGATMVAIAHGVSRGPTLHGRCRGCPAQLPEGDER